MRKLATSEGATKALAMLSDAQRNFVTQLSLLGEQQAQPADFIEQQWLRDDGLHGGGIRFEAPQCSLFNQASVNVSQIHFEDITDKNFISATALSTIIHPINPFAPSVHIHVSWTALRSGKSYWRLMADLNPAIPSAADTARFNDSLKEVAGEYLAQATQQGDDYFYIPALQLHRGVSHFYLEGFNPVDEDGTDFAQQFLKTVIDTYIAILTNTLNNVNSAVTDEQRNIQIDYHTRYFYQVLTLDKGTTAGLLIHDQNDVGTLGSLPRFINRTLLSQWAEQTAAPRNKLVDALVALLPMTDICEIDSTVKMKIASALRNHYQQYPL